MSLNIQTLFTTASKIRGGKAVWFKDAGNERRGSVPLGSTIANPYKGMGYAFAADLYEFKLNQSGYLLKTFLVTDDASNSTSIYVNGDGYSHVPEVGNVIMKAPDSLVVESFVTSADAGTKQKIKITFTAGCSANGNVTIGLDGTETAVAVTTAATTAAAVAALVGAASFPNYTVSYTASNDYVEFTADNYGPKAAATLAVASTGVTGTVEEETAGTSNVIKTESEYTGQSAKITAVNFNSTTSKFELTLDQALTLSENDILVEAEGTAKSSTAKVLVKNPNSFIELDTPFIPTNGSYGFENVSIAINVVTDKKAYVGRMQPLPGYVLAKNRSYIDGVFQI